MPHVTSEPEITGLIVVDPYNDFISDGGKLLDRLSHVAVANQCVPHMLQVVEGAQGTGLRIFYALHHRYRTGDYETWKYLAPTQKAAWMSKAFEYGKWGGEIGDGFEPQPGDVVALEHWCSGGFANTDLDLQLKEHGIHKAFVVGLIATTASFLDEHMHAALDINMPTYASAIVPTSEVLDSIARTAAYESTR